MGLLLLKLSTSFLPVSGFTTFSQFLAFAALLNMVAVAGAQNGLIRQAAAGEDDAALARAQSAALLMWGLAGSVLGLAITIGSGRIARILVGTPDQRWVVVTIALLALAAGPGQIWCSILTGRKRVTRSLLAQALGLLTSTATAGALILRGDPVAATIGFAGGPLVTMATAFLFARGLHLRFVLPARAAAEIRVLLRYSAAFAATTGFSSVLLFGLRSLYRDDLGTVPLGYWLAANRISDMSTQLLGLFMIQFYVPHFAMLETEAARRALILRCWAAGVAVMGTIVLLFSALSRPLIHIFLSDAWLPAIPAIRTYMVGDCLRVWACLAMHTAFARGRPGRYAAIEIGTLTVMAAVTVGLIEAGEVRAPLLGYAGAYGVTAVLVTVGFAWESRAGRRLCRLPYRSDKS